MSRNVFLNALLLLLRRLNLSFCLFDVVEVRLNSPFKVGFNRVKDRLGRLNRLFVVAAAEDGAYSTRNAADQTGYTLDNAAEDTYSATYSSTENFSYSAKELSEEVSYSRSERVSDFSFVDVVGAFGVLKPGMRQVARGNDVIHIPWCPLRLF